MFNFNTKITGNGVDTPTPFNSLTHGEMNSVFIELENLCLDAGISLESYTAGAAATQTMDLVNALKVLSKRQSVLVVDPAASTTSTTKLIPVAGAGSDFFSSTTQPHNGFIFAYRTRSTVNSVGAPSPEAVQIGNQVLNLIDVKGRLILTSASADEYSYTADTFYICAVAGTDAVILNQAQVGGSGFTTIDAQRLDNKHGMYTATVQNTTGFIRAVAADSTTLAVEYPLDPPARGQRIQLRITGATPLQSGPQSLSIASSTGSIISSVASIVDYSGIAVEDAPPSPSYIMAGNLYDLVFDGTNWVCLNPEKYDSTVFATIEDVLIESVFNGFFAGVVVDDTIILNAANNGQYIAPTNNGTPETGTTINFKFTGVLGPSPAGIVIQTTTTSSSAKPVVSNTGSPLSGNTLAPRYLTQGVQYEAVFDGVRWVVYNPTVPPQNFITYDDASRAAQRQGVYTAEAESDNSTNILATVVETTQYVASTPSVSFPLTGQRAVFSFGAFPALHPTNNLSLKLTNGTVTTVSKPLFTTGVSPLTANQSNDFHLKDGITYEAIYNGVYWVVLNPSSPSDTSVPIGLVSRNYLEGLQTHSAGSGAAIWVDPGRCMDSTNTVEIVLPSALTAKVVGTNWSAGGSGGAKPTSVSLTANTMYHIFVIRNAAGNVDVGIDSSATATNLLATSGYTHYRRIGQCYALTATTIRDYSTFGRFNRKRMNMVQAVVVNDSTLTTTEEFVSVTYRDLINPFTAFGYVAATNVSATSTGVAILRGSHLAGTGSLGSPYRVGVVAASSTISIGGHYSVDLNTSGSLAYRGLNTVGGIEIFQYGWESDF